MNYSRYIGRVGGLAIALGIGVAIGQGCAVASADDAGTTSSTQRGQAGASRHATGPRVTPRRATPSRTTKVQAAKRPSSGQVAVVPKLPTPDAVIRALGFVGAPSLPPPPKLPTNLIIDA